MSAKSRPANVTDKRFAPKPLAMADRAERACHVLRHPLLHQRALVVGEGVQHIALGAGERSLIARFLLALERLAHLLRRVARIDRNGRLFVGKEQPVAIFLGQFLPRAIDVVAKGHGDIAQVLPVTLGYDVDRPWREIPRKDRDWILFTDEQPTVPVYAGFTREKRRRAQAQGGAELSWERSPARERYVLHTFAKTTSALMKKRVAQFMVSTECPVCHGKRLRPESLSVKFAGLDIAEISRLPLKRLGELLRPLRTATAPRLKKHRDGPSGEGRWSAQRIAEDLVRGSRSLLDLGLGYLVAGAQHADALARRVAAPAAGDPGALQSVRRGVRARRASAGLHPADTEALLARSIGSRPPATRCSSSSTSWT